MPHNPETPTPSTIFFACPKLALEHEDLLDYRAALLVLFPNGSNVRAPQPPDGTLSWVNEAFKALSRRHKRRLEGFRCTIDRLRYIERVS